MSISKLQPDNSKEFLEANRSSYTVLLFDAAFTEQGDIVKDALRALEEAPELKGRISLATVDVEDNNDLATQYSVLSVPIIVCLKNGEVTKKIDTLEPTKLVNTVVEDLKRLEIISGESSQEVTDPKEKFQAYLKELVRRANVMIFMKGNPEAPRCGFSKQLVEILGRHEIKYQTFDILQDDDVRQGLKEFSDWPTYPQIYVKGEFVGGLDILKQLEETGELEATLKG